MSEHRILRIVPKGEKHTWDEDTLDLDQECDLVAIALREEQGEIELDRMSFATGHVASKFMCGILKKGKKNE